MYGCLLELLRDLSLRWAHNYFDGFVTRCLICNKIHWSWQCLQIHFPFGACWSFMHTIWYHCFLQFSSSHIIIFFPSSSLRQTQYFAPITELSLLPESATAALDVVVGRTGWRTCFWVKYLPRSSGIIHVEWKSFVFSDISVHRSLSL